MMYAQNHIVNTSRKFWVENQQEPTTTSSSQTINQLYMVSLLLERTSSCLNIIQIKERGQNPNTLLPMKIVGNVVMMALCTIPYIDSIRFEQRERERQTVDVRHKKAKQWLSTYFSPPYPFCTHPIVLPNLIPVLPEGINKEKS
jgi:hypothetical protein